jgi:16S rRNA (guanine966-N2)-methyltransferase
VRIISGTARGTRLQSADTLVLRPMLDRVKESLFGILRDTVSGARVLDLFGGSGALGLEALSRGADTCVFVEREARLVELIARNAQKCKASERCEILPADVLDLPGREPTVTGLPATLVFVDPPYVLIDDPNRRAQLFGALEALVGTWMVEGAEVVLHHRPLPHAVWPTGWPPEHDKRIYGQSQLTFFDATRGNRDGR